MRTAQEIFDTVVNHLRKQNKKALNHLNRCSYRGDNGTKCAVGCLISNAEYSRFMEGANISDLLASGKLSNARQKEFSAHETLLAGLQTIHDYDAVSAWEADFSSLATQHKLIYNPKD